MSSPSTVITLGFGTFGSVNLLPSLGFGPFGINAIGFGRLEYTIPQQQLDYTLAADRPEFTLRPERLEFTGVTP